ncbi:MAG: tryptophan 2,3-dioxygenase family protein [Planctomycetota bacterium]
MSVPTYWDYLRLDQLLALQGGLEGDDGKLAPDELHFIIVHQAFELWFKLVLRELRLARDHLAAPKVPEEAVPYVVHHLRRTNEILRLCRDQFRIMETLTPQDFLSFRDKLIPASGFQSFQMREIEILLGLEDEGRVDEVGVKPFEAIRALAEGSPGGVLAWSRIEAVRQEQTLRSCLHTWLYRTPIQGSSPEDPGDAEVVRGFLDEYLAGMERLDEGRLGYFTRVPGADEQATRGRLRGSWDLARSFLFAEDLPEAERPRAQRSRAGLLFIESYRRLPLLAWPRVLIDTIVELEENLVLWRTCHARMVERVIGRRIGTGGSSGVGYLDATTRYRIFTSLWTVRTLLLPRSALPKLKNAERYAFASGGS